MPGSTNINSFYLRHILLSVRIDITYPVFITDGILTFTVMVVWFIVRVSFLPAVHTCVPVSLGTMPFTL